MPKAPGVSWPNQVLRDLKSPDRTLLTRLGLAIEIHYETLASQMIAQTKCLLSIRRLLVNSALRSIYTFTKPSGSPRQGSFPTWLLPDSTVGLAAKGRQGPLNIKRQLLTGVPNLMEVLLGRYHFL